jgi:hypothetical protein
LAYASGVGMQLIPRHDMAVDVTYLREECERCGGWVR